MENFQSESGTSDFMLSFVGTLFASALASGGKHADRIMFALGEPSTNEAQLRIAKELLAGGVRAREILTALQRSNPSMETGTYFYPKPLRTEGGER